MEPPVNLFAEAAREYCDWCENPGQNEGRAAEAALQFVARLYLLALDLRRPAGADLNLEGERPSDQSFHALCKRLALLPFQYYGVIFDPMPVPPEEPVVGDVADDLADIHRDLSEGLSLYDSDHPLEAEWCWRESFEYHWGRHASQALNALHCWMADGGG